MSKPLDMKEVAKARAWREARGLTFQRLADLTGFSKPSVYWFLRGEAAPNRGKPSGALDPAAWHRFRLVCAAIDREMRGLPKFNWEVE